MRPDIAPGIVGKYRFQCFCGACIATTEKTVTCANCGKALGIHRVRSQRVRWKTLPLRAPYRRLQPGDLKELAIRIALYLLLAYYVYDLLDR
jgi:hypothetical protein